jgi:hypothetical protein
MSNLLAKKYTISDDQCQLIIEDYLSGMFVKDIYRKYDIHSTTLYYILDVMKVPTRSKVDKGRIPTHKKCRTCGATKPIEEFKVQPGNRDGRGCHCLICYRAKDRVKSKKNRMKTRYGVSPEEYKEMVSNQFNKCAICGNEETCLDSYGNIRPLAIDHDHVTNKVRGLLCHKCNLGLGHFQDDIDRLQSAIQYLRED